MLLLRWLWIGNGKDGEIPPIAVFWTLRVLMFVISFVLEDWALHELIPSPKHRRVAVLLVASSYVTWTYQTHTFSNSVETLVVAWSLVLIQRVADPRVRHLHAITTNKNYQLTSNSTHSSGHVFCLPQCLELLEYSVYSIESRFQHFLLFLDFDCSLCSGRGESPYLRLARKCMNQANTSTGLRPSYT